VLSKVVTAYANLGWSTISYFLVLAVRFIPRSLLQERSPRRRSPVSAGTPSHAPPGETPGRPLFGSLPAPGRRWAPQALRRGHRAPPRGVDVKATPRGGLQEAPGAEKHPQNPKNRENSHFSGFWPILAFLAKNRHFRHFPDLATRGVLHQPLAAGPCTRPGARKRQIPGVPPEKAKNPDFRGFWRFSPFWADLGSGPQRALLAVPAGDVGVTGAGSPAGRH